jgi:hypothetical protein
MGDQHPTPPDKLRPMPLNWLQLRLGVAPDAPLLRDRPASSLLLDRLDQAGRQQDALCLAAHALPPREAVWWACMCARHVRANTDRAPPDRLALDAAEAWVRLPDQRGRAQSFKAARQARFRSPEAMAAMGAFWSRAPEDEASNGQVGRSIESALRLAALCGPGASHPMLRQTFLASARDIARGGAGRIEGAAHHDRLEV